MQHTTPTHCDLTGVFCVVQDLPDLPEWELHFRVDGTVDRRRYNAPTAVGEVAGFMPGGCNRQMLLTWLRHLLAVPPTAVHLTATAKR